MKKLFLMLLTLVLISSCATEKRCKRKYPCNGSVRFIEKVFHDTIERVRDTTVILPADSAWLKGLLKCDSLGNAYLAQITELKTGKNVRAKVIVRDNKIYVGCNVDSASVYIAWKEKNIKTIEKKDSLVKSPEPSIRSPSKVANFFYVLRWIWDIWWILFLVGWLVLVWISRKIPKF